MKNNIHLLIGLGILETILIILGAFSFVMHFSLSNVVFYLFMLIKCIALVLCLMLLPKLNMSIPLKVGGFLLFLGNTLIGSIVFHLLYKKT